MKLKILMNIEEEYLQQSIVNKINDCVRKKLLKICHKNIYYFYLGVKWILFQNNYSTLNKLTQIEINYLEEIKMKHIFFS